MGRLERGVAKSVVAFVQGKYNAVGHYLFEKCDPTALALFRILFGKPSNIFHGDKISSSSPSSLHCLSLLSPCCHFMIIIKLTPNDKFITLGKRVAG